jgi:hypothetical protein
MIYLRLLSELQLSFTLFVAADMVLFIELKECLTKKFNLFFIIKEFLIPLIIK